MISKLFYSVLSKLSIALNSVLILKILSIYLEPDHFSKYYLNYNLALYIFTILFTIHSSVLLRYYHHESKLILSSFFYKLNWFTLYLASTIYFLFTIFFNYDFLEFLTIIIFCFSFGFYNFYITLFRIKGLFRNIFILQIIQTSLCISLLLVNKNILNSNIIFIVISISQILPFIFFKKQIKINFNGLEKHKFTKKDKSFINYAAPIIVISFTTFALSSSDQFFLKLYNYNEDLSGYIANYNIAEKGILIVLSVMSFIFQPYFFKKHNILTSSAIKDVTKVALVFLLLSFIFYLFIKLFSSDITILLTSKKYIKYSWIIPIIFIGGIFIGLNSLFSELLTLSLKTNKLMYSYLIGLTTNVILNYNFIPKYGVTAAVWSSIISYIIIFITTLIFIFNLLNKKKHV